MKTRPIVGLLLVMLGATLAVAADSAINLGIKIEGTK